MSQYKNAEKFTQKKTKRNNVQMSINAKEKEKIRKLLRKKDYESANFQIIENYVLDEEICYFKAKCLLNELNFEECIKYCKKSIEIDSEFSEAFFLMGDCYFQIGLFDEAVNQYKKVICLNSKNFQALYNISLIFFEQIDNPREALKYMLKCHKIKPNAFTKNQLGRIYIELTEFSKAIKVLKEAKKLRSSKTLLAEIHFSLGEAHYNLYEYNEAITYYEKSHQLDEKHSIINNIGFCHFLIVKLWNALKLF